MTNDSTECCIAGLVDQVRASQTMGRNPIWGREM